MGKGDSLSVWLVCWSGELAALCDKPLELSDADMARLIVARTLLVVAGVISLCLSAWGFLASMGLGFDFSVDGLLSLCFLLPFPTYLLSLYSLKWSALQFWALFVVQWMARALLIRPNPEINPLDEFGVIYLCLASAVLAAYLLGPRDRRHKLSAILFG